LDRINRDQYLSFLKNAKDKQIIKVVSGVRRCGKSTLLEIFRDYLGNNNVEERQIIFINFEDMKFEHLKSYTSLYDYITSLLIPDKMNYIFLDEIQHVANFEKTVNSLFINKNCDLYLTGSNAYFMSGELATLLSGRYIEIKMLPLSYKEFSIASDNKNSSQTKIEKYNAYLQNSSFPYTLQLTTENEIRTYLQGIYDSVLLKDIVARLHVHDVLMLESVVKYLFDNIGNVLSTTKISNTMTTNGRKIDQKTVEKYVKGLMNSLIVYQVKRYNVKGKQHLASLEKYYIVDIGLRYLLLGKRSTDVGHILENIIYLELIRRGYEVSVGKVDDLEIDFIATNANGVTYFQVAASVRDEKTLERELESLRRIPDHYPKYILTLDEDPEADYNGITRTNALDWLLKI